MTGGAANGAFNAMVRRLSTRAGLDDLPQHLEAVHGIEVAGLEKLDIGVFRVDRRDGDPWVARVFRAERSTGAVDGDVDALRHVEAHDFPAERPASGRGWSRWSS